MGIKNLGGSKNIIELNGKRYDALSGKLLGGLGKVKKGADNMMSGIKPAAGSHKHSEGSKRHINFKAPRKPEPSKTLMRSAVKPPKSSIKLSKVQTKMSDSLVASTAELLDTPASRKAIAAARRQTLSEQIAKNPKVQRFASTVADFAAPKAAQIGINLSKPPAAKKLAEPKPNDNHARLQTLLANGLAKAKSHEQPAPKVKKKRNRLFIPGIILALLIIAGTFTYIFRSNIEIQIAALRSGVHAELPGYVPSGFSFKGPIQFTAGSVTTSYKDGSKVLTIVEENSDWDSETLKDSVVTVGDGSYQTAQNGGRTIYFYGQGKATWVNDGIWYQLESSPNIGTGQLLKIVSSM